MPCGTGSGNFPQPGDPSNDSVLIATSAFGGIDVSWTYPGLNPHAVAHTILYRNTIGTEGSEIYHATVNSDHYFDHSENDAQIEYFYWIRHVSINGTQGELIGPASAIAKPRLEDYIALLSGQITESNLAQSLMERLDKIDLLDLDLAAEIQARINGESLLGTELDVIQTDIDGVGVALNQEINTRQTEYSAMLQTINTLQASSEGSLATLQTQVDLIADENSAQATSISNLQSTVNDPVTGLLQTYADLQTEITARADADSALTTSISNLDAVVTNPTTGLAAAHAAIITEQTARADADTILSQSITTLRTEVEDPVTGLPAAFAAVQDEETARVAADDALASTYNTLLAIVNDPSTGLSAAHAAIQTEQTTRANADTALGNSITTIQASIDDPNSGLSALYAAIQTEETARVDGDNALSSSITTVEAAINHPTTGLQAAHDAIVASSDGKIVTYYQAAPPTAQAVGDLWIETDNGNLLYRWNGSAWQSVRDAGIENALQAATNAQAAADGKINAFWSNSTPANPEVGDLWFDTDDQNHPYRWNGTSWEDARDGAITDAITQATDAQSTADGKVTTFYSNGAPTAEGIGDLWVDTDNQNRLFRWDGASWINIQDGTIADAQNTADQAYAIAEGKINTFYQSTAPTAEAEGDLWIDGNNVLHRWSGSAWESVRDGAVTVALGKSKVFFSNSAPTAENIDDLWFDTDNDDKPYRWNGSSWVPLNVVTDTEVAAQIVDNNVSMIGYCEIGGNPNTDYGTPAGCEAVGGTWITSVPLAESVKKVSIQTTQQTAALQTMMQAYADEFDNILAEYTVKLDVNGYVSGFGITNNGATSDAIFNVDNFAVGKLGSVDIYPFIVEAGSVFIDDAYINQLTFDKLRATDSSLVVENGVLKADYIDADNLVVRQAQSDTFVSGSTGWNLDRNGDAEFNSITIYDSSGGIAFQTGVTEIPDLDAINISALNANPQINMVGRDGLPAGYTVNWDSSHRQIAYYDAAKTEMRVYSTTGGFVGVCSTATRLVPGAKYKLRVSARKSTSNPTRIITALYCRSSDMPAGTKYVVGGYTSVVGEIAPREVYLGFNSNEEYLTSAYVDYEFTVIIPDSPEIRYGSAAVYSSDGHPIFINTLELTEVSWEDAGDLAKKDQIDNATYIANGIINTAHIVDANITTAKIDDLAVTESKLGNASVDTLKIAGNAVTVMQASEFSSKSWSSRSAWQTLGSIVVNHGDSASVDLVIDASSHVKTNNGASNSTLSIPVELRFTINGVSYYSGNVYAGQSYVSLTSLVTSATLNIKKLISLPSGNHTLTMYVRYTGSTFSSMLATGNFITVTAAKR